MRFPTTAVQSFSVAITVLPRYNKEDTIVRGCPYAVKSRAASYLASYSAILLRLCSSPLCTEVNGWVAPIEVLPWKKCVTVQAPGVGTAPLIQDH